MMNLSELIRINLIVRQTLKGGEGSGNFGHTGRPGKVGGSAEEDKIMIRNYPLPIVTAPKVSEDYDLFYELIYWLEENINSAKVGIWIERQGPEWFNQHCAGKTNLEIEDEFRNRI